MKLLADMELLEECQKCPLAQTRTQVVVKRGSDKPRVVFVGESPGVDEDEQGLPFVGRSGKLLDKWIEFIGLKPEDYSIINTVFCRAHTDGVDRKPTKEESAACRENFLSVYNTFNPVVTVALGRTAEARLKELKIDHEFLYHPSFYLRMGGVGWEESLSTLKTNLNKILSQQRL